MSRRKPKGLLSFIRNTTGVAAYRDEMHVDMRTGFDRFDVVDGAVQEVCFAVEQAAYEIRRNSHDRFGRAALPLRVARHAAARQLMADSSRKLFEKLAIDLGQRVQAREDFGQGIELGQEIRKDATSLPVRGEGPVEVTANGVSVLPTRELGEAPLLLDILYYFVHFPDTRAALLRSQALERAVAAIDNARGARDSLAETRSALGYIARYLEQAEGSPQQVQRAVTDLCEMLAVEYDDRASCFCW